MTARKRTAKPSPTAPVEQSSTGTRLVDGLPYFATLEGVPMHRRQWLAATAEARKAQLVVDLREDAAHRE